MAIIDSRLKDCDTDQDVTENFNRVLNIVDSGSGGSSKVKYVTMNESMELNCTPNDVEQWLEETNNELQIIVKSVQNGTVSFVPINTIMENTLVATVGSTFNQFVADGKDNNYKYVQLGGQ